MEPLHGETLHVTSASDSSYRYDDAGAEKYRGRSRSRNAAETRLLDALLDGLDLGNTLDAPCGGGRIRGILSQHGAHWVGLDLAPAMLANCVREGGTVVRGRVDALPFADQTFATVTSFRYLHHVHRELQKPIVSELARVARDRLVLSAFHPISAHAARRRIRAALARRPLGRHSTPPSLLDTWLAEVGFERRGRRRHGILRDLWVGLWVRRETGDKLVFR